MPRRQTLIPLSAPTNRNLTKSLKFLLLYRFAYLADEPLSISRAWPGNALTECYRSFLFLPLSDGYSSADIRYVWWIGKDSVSKEDVNLPQFQVKEHKIDIKETVLSTGMCHFRQCCLNVSLHMGLL